ncbi:MAG: hypothetical protein IJT36_00575 [Alphaproteobacteria bacterium]|nr:hypothetical protein [Alphaproteobacteria bacterium]
MKEELQKILSKCKSKNAVEMLKEYAQLEDLSFVKPAPVELLSDFENTIAKFPKELREVYEFTNGFFSPMFDLLPIFDKNNIKRTWDSINRANSIENTFDFSQKWLDKYCIFGRFNGRFAAAFYKEDCSLWIEYPDGGMYEKKTSLRDFLLIGLESY